MKYLYLMTLVCLIIKAPNTYAVAQWDKYPALEVTLLEAVPDQSVLETHKHSLLLTVAKQNELVKQIQNELESPFGRFIRQLDKMSRNYLQIEQGCEALNNQTLLYLSDTDGGYARHGFWFQSNESQPEYCNRLFVDMTVNTKDIVEGRFLEVFAHEMAHVFMRRLKGKLPPSPSTRFHNVFAVTDPQTAFDEGFGIYFQVLAAIMSDHSGFRARIEGRSAPTGAEHWFSNMDGRERIFGVMHNSFVFERMLPTSLSAFDAYHLEGMHLSFSSKLKNAQAMLASEGVIATLFYRLVTSPDIFALEPGNVHWQSTSLAIHKEIFDALAKSSWQSSPQPYLQFVLNLSKSNTEKQILKSFIATTYATTMNRDTTANAQSMIYSGQNGDMDTFVKTYSEHKNEIEELTKLAQQDRSQLSREIGVDIWVKKPQIQIKAAPWTTKNQPLTVNLNAATKTELLMLDALSDKDITDFLNHRSKDGPYADLADIQSRLGWTDGKIAKIAELINHFKETQATVRE